MTRTPAGLTQTPDLAVDMGGATAVSERDPFAVVPKVLELVRLTGAIFFRSEFRAPWSYWAPPAPALRAATQPGPGSLVVFHIVSAGQCWVALDDGIRHEVSQGDVVVMPYGDANSWGSYEAAEPVPIMSIMPPRPWSELPHLEYGGNGPETKVVCGYLSGDAVLFDPVLRALPSLFVVRPPAGPAATWLNASVEYAMSNPPMSRPDGQRDQRLAESLFTEVLRLYLQEPRNLKLTGWLAALGDPLVGPALSLLHADPARDWTVAELANAVAASRTVLVDGFVRLLGRPPIRYLTEWRLNLASGLLRASDSRVGEVAAAVGYTSEEAFSRAFKRTFGESPRRWRQAANRGS